MGALFRVLLLVGFVAAYWWFVPCHPSCYGCLHRLAVRYSFISNLLVCKLLIQVIISMIAVQALPSWPRE
jgi:hypothetical protein